MSQEEYKKDSQETAYRVIGRQTTVLTFRRKDPSLVFTGFMPVAIFLIGYQVLRGVTPDAPISLN